MINFPWRSSSVELKTTCGLIDMESHVVCLPIGLVNLSGGEELL